MFTTSRYVTLLGLAAALLVASAAQAAPTYSVTPIGLLGVSSHGAALNDHGAAVGNNYYQPFSYRSFAYRDGTSTDLGAFGGVASIAEDINNKGQIVGRVNYNLSNTNNRAVVITNGNQLTLGTLGGTSSTATGINESGQITGHSDIAGNAGERAYLYSNGIMISLGTLGGTRSWGQDINESGHVTGASTLAGNTSNHAFIYRSGAMTSLGSLIAGGSSYGWALNDTGQVVGYAHTNNGTHAFLYNNGIMRDLGTLASSYSNSYAWDINNHGQVVGTSDTGDYPAPSHGFIYQDGAMTDLNTLVDAASGWEIRSAYSINDAGHILADAYHAGTSRYGTIMLTALAPIPEPESFALFLTGLGVIGAVVRRRKSS